MYSPDTDGGQAGASCDATPNEVVEEAEMPIEGDCGVCGNCGPEKYDLKLD